MIEKSILDKCHKVIEKYELDEYFVNDLISAICTADMLHGTNDKKLDVGRFSVAVKGDFYGIRNPHYSDEDVKPLPDIQVLRVLADTLILGVGSKVPSDIKGLTLANPTSDLIAESIGVSVGSDSYKDVTECNSIINTLYDLITLDGAVSRLESKIDILIDTGKNLANCWLSREDFHSATKMVKLPFKTKFLGTYSIDSNLTEEQAVDILSAQIIIYMADSFISLLQKAITKNKVKANLKLLTITREIGSPIGLNAGNLAVPTYEYRSFEGTTVYYNAKLDKIMTNGMDYRSNDIPTILALDLFMRRNFDSFSGILEKFNNAWYGGNV